jgi:hypothetical protein
MLIYYIFLFLSSLFIFKKTTIIFSFIILNLDYIWYGFHYLLGTDIFNYIIGITIGVICVFREDAILPFTIIYLFLFILYHVEKAYNFFGDFNTIV